MSPTKPRITVYGWELTHTNRRLRIVVAGQLVVTNIVRNGVTEPCQIRRTESFDEALSNAQFITNTREKDGYTLSGDMTEFAAYSKRANRIRPDGPGLMALLEGRLRPFTRKPWMDREDPEGIA